MNIHWSPGIISKFYLVSTKFKRDVQFFMLFEVLFF